MSEKETLMKQLNEASFALDEAVYFLTPILVMKKHYAIIKNVQK